MGEIVQRKQEATQGLPDIEIKALSGLSLKLDAPNQPNNVWKILQNFDLYIPGSIRKIRPALQFGPNAQFPILNFINYWAQPNRAEGPINRVIGIDNDAEIIDLVSGQHYTNLELILTLTTPLEVIPYLEVFPLYFNPYNTRTWMANTSYALTDCVVKYGTYDGVLYIYAPSNAGTSGAVEPVWTPPGPNIYVTDGSIEWVNQGQLKSNRFLQNALLIQVPNQPLCYFMEYQLNPASGSPQWLLRLAGIPPPEMPPNVMPITITPNLDGYAPVAGRGFVYTFYDPSTFHESSPSPFAGPTVINDVTGNVSTKETLDGSLLPPLPVSITNTGNIPYQSYQSYYVAVPQNIVFNANRFYNYSALFFYATKDGGATFYRIPVLLDPVGNIISNSDGSVSFNVLNNLMSAYGWTDEFPLASTSMVELSSLRVYEGSGPINHVPDPKDLNAGSWTQANAGQFVVVPGGGQPDPNGAGGEFASAELSGPGATTVLPKSTLRSNPFNVTPGASYFFEAYCDASEASTVAGQGGAAKIYWQVVTANLATVVAQLTWAPGAALTAGPPPGFQSISFTMPAGVTRVRIRAWAQGVGFAAPDGGTIYFSNPALYTGAAMPTQPTNYPTPDDSLVLPAPAALSQNNPPIGSQMKLYGGSVFILEQGTFKIWYSNTGDFASWGAFNYLPLDDTAGVPVLELANVFDRLLVGKQTSMSQITGGNGQFAEAPFEPNHGVQSARATIGFGSSFITLLGPGLTMVSLGARLTIQQQAPDAVSTGFRAENIIGDPVKPETDSIQTSTLRVNTPKAPCPGLDTNRNFYLFTFYTSPNDTLIKTLMLNMAHQGPSGWSELVPPIPNTPEGFTQGINWMREIIDPNYNTLVLLAAGSGDSSGGAVYELFAGNQDGSVQAIARTWPLPDLTQIPPQMRDTIKIFHELWVEGEDIANWTYQISVDYENTWTPPVPLQIRNKLGINGRQIQIQFNHIVASANNIDPLLSYIKITYSERRQASGKGGF